MQGFPRLSRGQEKDVGGVGTEEDVDCREEVDDVAGVVSGVEGMVGGAAGAR